MGLLKTIFIVPVVMVVATGSVAAVRWLYRHTSAGKGSTSVEERTKHIDEQTKNL